MESPKALPALAFEEHRVHLNKVCHFPHTPNWGVQSVSRDGDNVTNKLTLTGGGLARCSVYGILEQNGATFPTWGEKSVGG